MILLLSIVFWIKRNHKKQYTLTHKIFADWFLDFLTFTKVKVFRNFVICNWITNVLLVQSQHQKHQNNMLNLFKANQKHQNNMWNLFKANNKQNRTKSLTLLLTLNRFHTFFWCFCCWFWTSKCRLGLAKFAKTHVGRKSWMKRRHKAAWKNAFILSSMCFPIICKLEKNGYVHP